MIEKGNVITSQKIPHKNGTIDRYSRPFLVIDVQGDIITILDVSSVQGKGNKPYWSCNRIIKKYNPPLDKLSFVQFNSCRKIDIRKYEHRILKEKLNREEFDKIIERLIEYINKK